MGVTIHFEGQLRDSRAYAAILEMASAFAAARSWQIQPIECENARLLRVRDEQDWDYEGPTSGLELLPHPSCEPFRLEFDRDLYVQEYTKTQFAPQFVHEQLVELLDLLEPHFVRLMVEDEAGYFVSRDRVELERHRARCLEVLDEQLASDASLRGPVRLPSGRIADLMRG